MTAYLEARMKAEKGIESQKRYIRLRKSVEAAYGQPDGTGSNGSME
jgi:hypothetical protein